MSKLLVAKQFWLLGRWVTSMCYSCPGEWKKLSFAFLGHRPSSGWDTFMLSHLMLNIIPILKMRNQSLGGQSSLFHGLTVSGSFQRPSWSISAMATFGWTSSLQMRRLRMGKGTGCGCEGCTLFLPKPYRRGRLWALTQSQLRAE